MSEEAGGQDVLERSTLDPKIAAIVDEETRSKKGFLFCAACSHVIGHVQDRIEVQGSFQHTCTNPYGFRSPLRLPPRSTGLRGDRQRPLGGQLVRGFSLAARALRRLRHAPRLAV